MVQLIPKKVIFDLSLLQDEALEHVEPDAIEHVCATCEHKERVYSESAHAMVWRCAELTHRFREEVLVTPSGSCFESKSLADYWVEDDKPYLIW